MTYPSHVLKGVTLGVFCVVAAGLFSCMRQNVAVPASFLLKKGSIGLVWSCEKEKGTFMRSGETGLMPMLVNNVIAGSLPAKVESISLAPLVDQHFLNRFGNSMSEKSFQANMVRVPLDKKDLKNFKGTDKQFWLDFSEFKTKHNMDYVIYLDTKAFGTMQSYFDVIPTSKPRGYIQFDIYVVDTATNAIVGEYHDTKSVDPIDKWDNPPEYPEVVQTIEEAVKSSFESAYAALFK